jgi:two-component system LytT family sensor kinase
MTRPQGNRTELARNVGLTLVMLAALAAFFTVQGLLMAVARREPAPLWLVLTTHLQTQLWLLVPWAILVPAIGRLARALEIGRAPWPRVVLAQAAAGGLATVLVPAFYVLATPYVLRWYGADPQAPFVETFAKFFRITALTYFLILGFWVVVDYYRRFRERERAAAQLSVQLAEAQLQVLRAQVQPHFLFNALNAVSSLIHTNPDEADRMIGELGELLRASLEGPSEQQIPLRTELQTLEHYVEIMKVRFNERLRIRVAASPESCDVMVPSFVLQPLVENAIKHGIGPLEKGGTIDIEACRRDECLVLRVRDTGGGFADASAAVADHHGLAAIRQRLRLLYGAHGMMELANHPDGGAIVTLMLPWRTVPPTPEVLSGRSV